MEELNRRGGGGEKRMDELKKGQEVVIKSAKGLSGTVIASRDDGAEGVIYKVLIPERCIFGAPIWKRGRTRARNRHVVAENGLLNLRDSMS